MIVTYAYDMNLMSFFFLMIRRPPRSTLSLHDALPICRDHRRARADGAGVPRQAAPAVPAEPAAVTRDGGRGVRRQRDRKSTRLNSSHANISYAVFCLKKKKNRTRGCES